MEEINKPSKVMHKDTDYKTKEDSILKDIVNCDDEEEETDQSDHEQASFKEKKQMEY